MNEKEYITYVETESNFLFVCFRCVISTLIVTFIRVIQTGVRDKIKIK